MLDTNNWFQKYFFRKKVLNGSTKLGSETSVTKHSNVISIPLEILLIFNDETYFEIPQKLFGRQRLTKIFPSSCP